MPKTLADQIADAADRPGPDLAAPAFLVARIEYPRLDPEPYLDRLDRMGDEAARRVAQDPGADAPLAWLCMEPSADGAHAELRLTLWPGGDKQLLADADYHGRWVSWRAA